MGKIQILDEQLTNQIAAGEVVERPASVVKELVENAIDAQATRITIRITEGGISKIQVVDNGIGMSSEDALLAFARHATSKLKHPRDLFSIHTLGFRGEALPSVASVSRVTLTTTDSPDQLATQIMIEGGKQIERKEIAHALGTEVCVEDLFFNTPARLKYLKTVNTEMSHIADVVGRIAMAHPHISFQLAHQQRELFRTVGDGKLKHVVHAIYGRQVASHLIPLEGENVDFHINGFVVKPEVTRANRSYLTLILNGRYIRSLPLSQSVIRGYGTLLPVGRYPLVVLQINTDPKLTDVNVHPTKLEVRMSKEKECCQLIQESVRKALQQKQLIPTVSSQLPKRTPVVQEKLDFPLPTQSNAEVFQVKETKEEQAPPVRIDSPVEKESKKTNHDVSIDEKKEKPIKKLPPLIPLSQIHGTYIVAQTADGFYLMDQHAAHERIYYERFYQQLGIENPEQQMLAPPHPIEMSPAESKWLEAHLDIFAQWGIDMELFGGHTFLIRAHPTWFPDEKIHTLVLELFDQLRDNNELKTADFRDETAKMMACKAAIKANRHLRKDEMEQLIKQLSFTENPFTCPHGRPILVHFSKYELEKMFKRVM